LLSVQCITPDDGQRNCPKHVEFHFQNKFEKLVHLVGFIIRILRKYDGMARTRFMRHRMKATGTLKPGTEAMVSIQYRKFSEWLGMY
jgi:hypothetical protein